MFNFSSDVHAEMMSFSAAVYSCNYSEILNHGLTQIFGYQTMIQV